MHTETTTSSSEQEPALGELRTVVSDAQRVWMAAVLPTDDLDEVSYWTKLEPDTEMKRKPPAVARFGVATLLILGTW